MKNNLQLSFKTKIFGTALCALIASAIMFSCSKPSDADNKKFIGTWSDGSVSVSFAAGSDGTHLTQQAEVNYSLTATGTEDAACGKSVTLTYTVSGSTITASTSVDDNCTSGTMNMSGTLSGSTLTLIQAETSNGNSGSNTYTLTKQ